MDNNLNLATGLDLSVLDKLTPDQRAVAMSILQEYAQNGQSEQYNNLLLEDYAEAPVDILTFVDDYNYLGNAWHDAEGNSKLYPYWRKELVKIFPDNLTTAVNNAIFSGSRGRGKMNPIDTPVLTSEGFRPMGTIQAGDKVYGEDGELHEVVEVFPHGALDVYKVTFSDGTSCECGLEHLWEVEEIRSGKTKVVDTKYLIEHINESSFRIPMCKPIKFPHTPVYVNPFTTGQAVASGHLKAIPSEYLYNDIKNRTLLLKGIFEDDTAIIVNKAIVPDVTWLVHSMGGTVLVENVDDLNVHLIPRLPKDIANSIGVATQRPYREIVKIEKLAEKKECRCIYINSERHLYLVNDFIVTHNTEVATLVAAYLLHRILCLKDPIAHFHLKPTEKIVFAFMNIKLALAEEIGIAKFQNTLQSSPWFMAHGSLEGRVKKFWVPQRYNGQVAIDIKIGSQSDDLIGLPIYFCLDGDTVILTSTGEAKIKDLVDKHIQVPSINPEGKIVLSNECTVKQTATSDIEYEIELEDGSVIKCTPTHRFMLKDGTYKEAQYLTEDDELFDIKEGSY